MSDQIYSFKGKDYTVSRMWKETEDFLVHECHPARFFPQMKSSRWGELSCIDVLDHMKRIYEADMSFPIILDNEGNVMDGFHRLCKALMEGRNSIMYVQYEEEVKPDDV